MAVNDNPSRKQYTQGPGGTTTDWPVDFKFSASADLVVITTDPAGVDTTLTLDLDYSVTGAGSNDGGTVTIDPPVPAGHRITIYREVDLDQPTVLPSSGGWFPKVHEAVFDRIVMQIQQLWDAVERSIKLSPTSTDSAADLSVLLESIDDNAAAAEVAKDAALGAQVATEAARDTVLGYASGATPWTAPDINGGTIDGATIGGVTPAAGSFTSGAFLSGISLGGGSDILGNYEEGEWTPILRATTGTYAHTYSTQVGRYIRNGNAVHLWCTISLTAKDAGMPASTVYVYGLPFTTADVVGTAARTFLDAQYVTLASNCTMAVGSVAANDNKLALGCRGSGIGGVSVLGSGIADNSSIGFNTTLYLGD